ncbi:hypothetical protein ACLMJK_007726 [Lecanora helva]
MSSAACCSGSEHPGEPKGQTGDLHGLPTYIAEPSNGAEVKGIVVMIPDAFGWEFVNLRLLSDTFAERLGMRVLLPEFMAGKSADLSALMNMKIVTDKNASWLRRIVAGLQAFRVFVPFMIYNRFAVSRPRIEAFMKSLRESTELPIGLIGYCWGGRYAICLAHGTPITSNGKPLIDAAFTAHPSNVVIPAEIENIKLPVSVAHGTEDIVVSNADAKTIQDIFAKKEKEIASSMEGEKFEIKMIEGARHGFAVRGDPDDKAELGHGQIAEDQAVEWFQRWLLSKR